MRLSRFWRSNVTVYPVEGLILTVSLGGTVGDRGGMAQKADWGGARWGTGKKAQVVRTMCTRRQHSESLLSGVIKGKSLVKAAFGAKNNSTKEKNTRTWPEVAA